MAANPYAASIETTETPRDREYRLLARANRMLAEAKEKNDIGTTYRAVLFNRQIWNTFLIDLSDERNQLPLELRGALISLGIWVEKFSDRVCDGHESAEDLIQVNRSIMEGLESPAANPQAANG